MSNGPAAPKQNVPPLYTGGLLGKLFGVGLPPYRSGSASGKRAWRLWAAVFLEAPSHRLGVSCVVTLLLFGKDRVNPRSDHSSIFTVGQFWPLSSKPITKYLEIKKRRASERDLEPEAIDTWWYQSKVRARKWHFCLGQNLFVFFLLINSEALFIRFQYLNKRQQQIIHVTKSQWHRKAVTLDAASSH